MDERHQWRSLATGPTPHQQRRLRSIEQLIPTPQTLRRHPILGTRREQGAFTLNAQAPGWVAALAQQRRRGIVDDRRVDQWVEQRVLQTADRVIGVTPSYTAGLHALAANRPETDFITIENGYDANDFNSGERSHPANRLGTV